MKRIIVALVCIVLFLHPAPSVSASSEDISQIIRQAQAQAISNLGGITACDADAVMEESERILREEYGINAEVNLPISDSLYDLGYEDGYKDGMREAERKAEAEKEEMRNNRIGAYCSILFVVAISVIVSALDKRKFIKR